MGTRAATENPGPGHRGRPTALSWHRQSVQGPHTPGWSWAAARPRGYPLCHAVGTEGTRRTGQGGWGTGARPPQGRGRHPMPTCVRGPGPARQQQPRGQCRAQPRRLPGAAGAVCAGWITPDLAEGPVPVTSWDRLSFTWVPQVKLQGNGRERFCFICFNPRQCQAYPLCV